jgi:pSer/pThr/pTyr-binding forkhead associated (FHA) protein
VPKLFVQDEDRAYVVDLRPGESLELGRSRDCDLALSAERASRRHAKILGVDGGHAVQDLGSTNGTLLNGAPFTGSRALFDGDVLEVGGARIVYRSKP